jgi:tRNA (guanine37-N1)-methyltransferase
MSLSVGVISILPTMFDALHQGITGRAQREERVKLEFWNPRDFTYDAHNTVDDRPYGGGPGMVMKYAPAHSALKAAKSKLGQETMVIYLSPQGEPLTQAVIAQLAQQEKIILLSGRYEGIDERLIETDVDKEYSVGDFVVSGGELPCMLLIDAMTRLLPGALGHSESAQQDSFSNGLLDHPHYTRPECINDQKVPKPLLSGDHKAINRWRMKQALGRTWQKRPDLIKRRTLNKIEKQLLQEYTDEHKQT